MDAPDSKNNNDDDLLNQMLLDDGDEQLYNGLSSKRDRLPDCQILDQTTPRKVDLFRSIDASQT